VEVHEGLASVEVTLHHVGYMNTSGAWVIPPTVLRGDGFSEGMSAVVSSDDKTAYIDRSGKIVAKAATVCAGSSQTDSRWFGH